MHFAGRVSDSDPKSIHSSQLDTLLRVSHEVRMRFNNWLAGYDLNEGRYAVLQILAKSSEDGCSQTELAEHLCQSESNVSTLIKRMQKSGLVRRSRSDVDRRKSILLISATGLSRLAQIDRNRFAWERTLFKGIPTTDCARLFELLQKLEASLDASSNGRTENIVKFPPSSAGESPADHPTCHDPVEDPRSPQFALQQMLIALSAHAGTESIERGAA